MDYIADLATISDFARQYYLTMLAAWPLMRSKKPRMIVVLT